MDRAEIAQYTTLDFTTWRETASLVLTPKFQRREVWKTPARSYFIDSILRNMPVPPIIIRTSQSEDRKRTVREIIDGQQRLRALLDFVDDKYSLPWSLHNPNAGKSYSELADPDKTQILNYSFVCKIFKSISDSDVLEIFARMNTYSVGLNAQELRNGRYFGYFKQTAYLLAFEHLEFWRRYRIFSETTIARMLEVELTSELMIAEIAGQQDKKKTIDQYYADKDDKFPEKSKVESRFRTIIDAINVSIGDNLGANEFRRPPLFYTLFCVIYHKLYGLHLETMSTNKKGVLSKKDAQCLNEAVLRLSDKIVSAKQKEEIAKDDIKFIAACRQQTDNIKPRRVRFDRLYKEAFG